ncbi:MAG: L-serine ammonia-lyase, iron-sulfur-dependent, subunit alpha [Elusimicrobiota bacterium]
MNLLKEVLKHQVYPALGCTEPASVALCAAHAAKALGEPVREAVFTLDAGTYKNGMGVSLPNTGGRKGNLLAGALGLLVARPALRMEVLRASTPALVRRARALVSSGRVRMTVSPERRDSYVECVARGARRRVECVIAGSHTELSRLIRDDRVLVDGGVGPAAKPPLPFKELLRKETLAGLLRQAERMDAEDARHLKRGVEMNLAAAEAGLRLRKVGHYLQQLLKKGLLQDDVFSSTKILVACATDARMDGAPVPVMSSGESGNQGIVAFLVPWNVGRHFGTPEKTVLKSIAFGHLVNAFVKAHTGGVAPICGCAIAAGVGASAAIVYQRKGRDLKAITLAVNNVVSDIGGMLCDGAKGGCALKVVSSADTAIRSAYMGMHHFGITELEGFVGRRAEDTIRNLARISTVGMSKVDDTIVDIMLKKQHLG